MNNRTRLPPSAAAIIAARPLAMATTAAPSATVNALRQAAHQAAAAQTVQNHAVAIEAQKAATAVQTQIATNRNPVSAAVYASAAPAVQSRARIPLPKPPLNTSGIWSQGTAGGASGTGSAMPAPAAAPTMGPAPSGSMPSDDGGGYNDAAGGGGYDAGGGGPSYSDAPAYAPPFLDKSPSWQDDDSMSNTSAMVPVKSTSLQVAAPPPTLWQRILLFLGFGHKQAAPPTTVHGEPSTIREAVESTVRRARNGDQNAMALIAQIRDNAHKGVPRAQMVFQLMDEYTRAHPVAAMNGEEDSIRGLKSPLPSNVYADAVALSHGPLLSNPRIGQFLSSFGAEEQHHVMRGMGGFPHRGGGRMANYHRIGQIVGQARKLQAVRMPNSSISKFDANVGWELGD